MPMRADGRRSTVAATEVSIFGSAVAVDEDASVGLAVPACALMSSPGSADSAPQGMDPLRQPLKSIASTRVIAVGEADTLGEAEIGRAHV